MGDRRRASIVEPHPIQVADLIAAVRGRAIEDDAAPPRVNLDGTAIVGGHLTAEARASQARAGRRHGANSRARRSPGWIAAARTRS